VNPLDAHRPLPRIPDRRRLKYLRLKEWQAFQFGNDAVFCLVVIYNSKSIGLVQLVVIDHRAGTKRLYERMVPFWRTHVARGLFGTESHARVGPMDLRFGNHLAQGLITLQVTIEGYRGQPDVYGNLRGLHTTDTAPMVICQPFAENRALYSHKNLMPLTGTLRVGDVKHQFDAADSFMIMDDHKGYYPYAMQYDWLTGATNRGGRLLGFNLTRNQVLQPDRYNENGLWLDGRLHPLPPVRFERPGGVDAPWMVTDDYGRVRVRFTPRHPGVVKLNLGLMKSDYYGPYGDIDGWVLDSDGARVVIDGLFGMGEQKYVRA
jgi:hypothetical protein